MNQTNQSSPLLDTDQLDQFIEAGLDDFGDLLEEMIADAPGAIAGIQSALLDGDSVLLRKLAHAARGMFANYGCAELARELSALEAAPPSEAGRAREAADHLGSLWTASEVELRKWLSRNG